MLFVEGLQEPDILFAENKHVDPEPYFSHKDFHFKNVGNICLPKVIRLILN
jgi:hypothetical protein